MGSLPNLHTLATDLSSTYKFQLSNPDENISETNDCDQRKPNYRSYKGCTYTSQDEVSKLKINHLPSEELFRLGKPTTYHHKVRYTRSSGSQYNWQNFGPNWDVVVHQQVQTSFSTLSTRSSRSNAISTANNTFSNIGHGIGTKRKDSLSSSGGASSVRRLIAVVRSTPSRLGPVYSRKVLCRNFATLCLGHFTVTAALLPLISLQSSISTWLWPQNGTQQWDVGSLLMSGSFAVGSVFTLLSPTIIHLFGCNWTLVAGYMCTTVFFIAHLYPTIRCLIPAYVLFGVCIGPLTCAKTSYLITLANKLTYVMTEEEEIYDQINGNAKENIIQKLSRGLQASQDLGMVLGNTVVWYFLYHSQNIEHEKNILKPLFYEEERDEWICGSQSRPSFDRPLDDNVYNSTSFSLFDNLVVSCRTTATLVSVFVGCGLVAVALTAAFTNKIRLFLYQDPLERPQGVAVIQAVKNAFRDSRLQLAAPMSVFIGLHNGFIHADFSKWYVVCSLGVPNISLVFLSMGLLQSIAAFTLSLLSHTVPRYLVIVTGFIFHSCLLLVLLIWKPSGDDSALFYVIAAAWGVCSIIWETLNFNLLLHIYPDSTWQVAFVHGNFFKFLGLSLAFGFHGLLSTWVKLYALAFFMIVAIGPHTWLEMKLDSKRKSALSRL